MPSWVWTPKPDTPLQDSLYLINYTVWEHSELQKEIEMPVLLDHAIEDSTDIFGILGAGFEHPKPPLGMPLPQGSILGSLLFLLYISDLPPVFQWVNFVLNAGDINILVVDKEKEAFQHKITFVMQQLELWFWKNDLIVNTDKTCALSLHSHQNRYPSGPHIIFNNN